MDTTLYFFPGLGADKRLFQFLEPKLDRVEFRHPDLPRFQRHEALSSYAQRVEETLLQQGYSADRAVLVGMSFGGQLALELAKRRPPKAIILLACHRYSSRLTFTFRCQAKFSGFIPSVMFRSGAKLASTLFSYRERLGHEQSGLLASMARDVQREQLLFGASTAVAWKHTKDDDPDILIFHIQGARDWVIPFHEEEVTHQIDCARHLITFTHAAEVASALRSCLAQVDEMDSSKSLARRIVPSES